MKILAWALMIIGNGAVVLLIPPWSWQRWALAWIGTLAIFLGSKVLQHDAMRELLEPWNGEEKSDD